ncbi:MAG TPA: S8 family serine peptidase [Gaiellaceae bacterium]|nr:S8 family serine peptidase [Gaiellaceae bacterium]
MDATARTILLVAALALAAALAFASPARAAMPGVVVSMAPGTPHAAAERLLRRAGVLGVRRVGKTGWLMGRSRNRAAALATLERSPSVEAAEPDATVHAAFVPADPFYSVARTPARVSGLEQAWNVTLGNPSITIAVVDTGVDPIPDLASALVPGHDFLGGDTTDPNGHGTEVASVAAARIDNGLGIAGACGLCSVMPVRVLDAQGQGLTSTVAEGITWAADHGARIINLSLAGTKDDPVLDAAIAYATDHGAVVVIAAGNFGTSTPAYPAAGAPEAIRVAASDPAGSLFSWSDHGSWVDIAAPGNPSVLLSTGGVSSTVLGTSLSAPLVAGVAGLLLSWQPTLDPAAVKDALLRGGAPTPGLDVTSGRRLDAFGAFVAAGYVTAHDRVLTVHPVSHLQAR